MPNEPLTPKDDFELPVAGFQGTAEEIERQWFQQVYKGRGDSMPQLTWRAVLMGSVLGGVLSLTNLYIGLKAGWGFGVAITACILSYAVWTGLYRLGLAKTKMTILENNCMQSTASSAGYSTGGTLVSAFAAYILLNGHPLPIPLMLGWVFFLAVLGVTMAIPMKRQMINIEQLRFPSGIAAAETLRALHSHGEKGMRAAKALAAAGVLAAVNQFWAEGFRLISSRLEPFSISALVEKFNQTVFGKAWMGRTVMFSWDPIFLAAGALTGLRVSASMMLGGTLCWAVFVPIMQITASSPDRAFATSSNGPCGAAWPAWSPPACSPSPCNGGACSAFRNLGKMFSRAEGGTTAKWTPSKHPRPGSLPGKSSRWWLYRGWHKRPSTCRFGRVRSPSRCLSSWPWSRAA